MMDPKAFGARLLILLSSKGLITGEQAKHATTIEPEMPEKVLVQEGWISRQILADITAQSFGAEPLQGHAKAIDGVLSLLIQKKYQLFPIASGEELVVAAMAPGTGQCSQELSSLTDLPVRYQIVDRMTLGEYFQNSEEELKLPTVVAEESEQLTQSDPQVVAKVTGPLVGSRYRRGEKLLQGRFSTLYKGRDEKTGMPVAIRHLESFAELNDVIGAPASDARSQTLREGRVLAKLCHPSLPRVRKLVQNDDDILSLIHI